MLDYTYYIVYRMAERRNIKHPFFVTYTLIENKGFYRIGNLG